MAFLGKLFSKDTSLKLKDIIINLEFLADAEAQISEFYRLCAAAMPKEKDFWNSLADQELRHADGAKEMIRLINKEPNLYKPGISFNTAIIRMFTLEMGRLVEQIRDGRISPDKLFAIALGIEDSAVEVSYGKIVKTKNKAFISLARQIDRESAEHKSAISSRLSPAPQAPAAKTSLS